ncbi:IS30 family transposase [Patescibacteria group bacterium]|nr:IS30 family transposase [Patescibacteria group bacterium]
MRKGTTYQQLTYEERVSIETLRRRGLSLRSIALSLGRSVNTVSKEVREKMVCGVYRSRKAHHKTYVRRWRSKQNCMKVALSPELTQLVREKLVLGWSPERIAGYARRTAMPITQKAIYRYVRSRALEQYLFWERHHQKRGRKRGTRLPSDTAKKLIASRPHVRTSGHWELDFIVSRQSPVVLLVLVDRWTRYALVRKLYRKTHHAVLRELGRIKQKHQLLTITTDNDIVFQKWQLLELSLSVPFYFASPYCSWEKGLVENTNRWIRTIVPKRSDLRLVTTAQLIEIDRLLNKTPRQCLGFQTAEEVLLANRVS